MRETKHSVYGGGGGRGFRPGLVRRAIGGVQCIRDPACVLYRARCDRRVLIRLAVSALDVVEPGRGRPPALVPVRESGPRTARPHEPSGDSDRHSPMRRIPQVGCVPSRILEASLPSRTRDGCRRACTRPPGRSLRPADDRCASVWPRRLVRGALLALGAPRVRRHCRRTRTTRPGPSLHQVPLLQWCVSPAHGAEVRRCRSRLSCRCPLLGLYCFDERCRIIRSHDDGTVIRM